MAGIFDRLTGGDNLPVHFITGALVLGAEGEFTNQNILDALNNQVVTAIDSASETDLLNIKTELLAQTGSGGRADYMHRLESIMIAVAIGEFNNETNFRSFLGIT